MCCYYRTMMLTSKLKSFCSVKIEEPYCLIVTHDTLQPQLAGVLAPRAPGPRQLGAGHGGAAAAAAAGRGWAAGGGGAAGGLGAARRAAGHAGAEGHYLGGDAQAGEGSWALGGGKTTSRPILGQCPPSPPPRPGPRSWCPGCSAQLTPRSPCPPLALVMVMVTLVRGVCPASSCSAAPCWRPSAWRGPAPGWARRVPLSPGPGCGHRLMCS